MASATGIRAGAAYIELAVDQSKLIQGLRAAGARLKAFGHGLKDLGSGMKDWGTKLSLVGGAAVGGLLAGVKVFTETGHQLDLLSKRTGIGVEALSELDYAARLSGVGLDDVAVGLRGMQKTIGGAANGSVQAARALATLGLSAAQLQTLSPDQQFAVIAQRLSAIQDPALRASAAMKVFGRSGTSLLPMLQNLPALQAEARRLGVVMSEKDVAAAASLDETLQRLWAVIRSVATTVGSALAPVLEEWAGKAAELVASFRTWLSENKGLVVSILQVGLAVLAAGAALVALGSVISTLGGILGALGTAFSILSSVASAALSFLLTPFGMVTAAVVALGVGILWVSGAGGKALDWLSARFDDLKNFALESFQGIKDALAAGDVALAARIFWLSVKTVWLAGLNTLKGWWLAFKDWFLQKTNDLSYGTVALMSSAWFGLRRMWLETVNFWADVLGKFASFFKHTWADLNGWAAKQWTKVLGLIDKDVNVEATIRRIDAQTKAENLQISSTTLDARLGRAKELTDLEKDRKADQVAIAQAADKEDRARRSQYEQERQDSEAALQAAKDEWAAAVAEAREKRAAKEAAGPDTGKGPGLPQLPALAAAQVWGALSIVGTFSPEAASRMGLGASVAERTAKATEETARYTKRIAQSLEESPDVFE